MVAGPAPLRDSPEQQTPGDRGYHPDISSDGAAQNGEGVSTIGGSSHITTAPAGLLPGGLTLSAPVDSTRITSRFGWRLNPTGPGAYIHIGQDYGVPCGSPVRAAEDGTVVQSAWAGHSGQRVRVDHGSGVETAYSHNSLLVVHVGDTVRQGDLLALSGTTGNSTGCHVHFEVYLNGKWVDPARFLPLLPGQKRPVTPGERREIEDHRASPQPGDRTTTATGPAPATLAPAEAHQEAAGTTTPRTQAPTPAPGAAPAPSKTAGPSTQPDPAPEASSPSPAPTTPRRTPEPAHAASRPATPPPGAMVPPVASTPPAAPAPAAPASGEAPEPTPSASSSAPAGPAPSATGTPPGGEASASASPTTQPKPPATQDPTPAPAPSPKPSAGPGPVAPKPEPPQPTTPPAAEPATLAALCLAYLDTDADRSTDPGAPDSRNLGGAEVMLLAPVLKKTLPTARPLPEQPTVAQVVDRCAVWFPHGIAEDTVPADLEALVAATVPGTRTGGGTRK